MYWLARCCALAAKLRWRAGHAESFETEHVHPQPPAALCVDITFWFLHPWVWDGSVAASISTVVTSMGGKAGRENCFKFAEKVPPKAGHFLVRNMFKHNLQQRSAWAWRFGFFIRGYGIDLFQPPCPWWRLWTGRLGGKLLHACWKSSAKGWADKISTFSTEHVYPQPTAALCVSMTFSFLHSWIWDGLFQPPCPWWQQSWMGGLGGKTDVLACVLLGDCWWLGTRSSLSTLR